MGYVKHVKIVEGHLLWEGFLDGYTEWVLHGELFIKGDYVLYHYGGLDTSDDMRGLLYDTFGKDQNNTIEEENCGNEAEKPCEEAEKFYKLMADAEQELYPGCTKFSKLSFIARLLQIKCLGNWSNASFTMVIDLLKEAFPDVGGPDKWGRVRLGGYGATAVQVYEGRPSKGACYCANTAYQQEIGKLSQRVDEQDKMIQEQHRQIQELMKLNKKIIGTMDPRPNQQMPSSSSHFPTISRKHSTSSNAKKPLKVGNKVQLKNAEEYKTVAVGFIESLDPNKKVSGVALGKQWCEVRVIIGVDMDEELPRSFLDFTTIGEVIGKYIAWPLYLVQKADDD